MILTNQEAKFALNLTQFTLESVKCGEGEHEKLGKVFVVIIKFISGREEVMPFDTAEHRDEQYQAIVSHLLQEQQLARGSTPQRVVGIGINPHPAQNGSNKLIHTR